jgi:ankyrin repeat protein
LLLERGADVQARARSFGVKCGYRDATLLHVAAAWGKAEMVDLLVQRRPELLNACAARRKTPLHAAAENGHLAVVERLLRHGADASAADEEGKTALDRAREAQDSAIVEALGRTTPPA